MNQKIYTIEDIYSLLDGERAELIDSQIFLLKMMRRLEYVKAFRLM